MKPNRLIEWLSRYWCNVGYWCLLSVFWVPIVLFSNDDTHAYLQRTGWKFPILYFMEALGVASLMWGGWLLPWVRAGQMGWRAKEQRKPRSLSIIAWLPCVVMAQIALIPVLVNTTHWIKYGQWLMTTGDWIWISTSIVVMILFTLPAPSIRRAIDHRFQECIARNSICLHCGYDLRGNATTSQCPECGVEVSTSIDRNDACKQNIP